MRWPAAGRPCSGAADGDHDGRDQGKEEADGDAGTELSVHAADPTGRGDGEVEDRHQGEHDATDEVDQVVLHREGRQGLRVERPDDEEGDEDEEDDEADNAVPLAKPPVPELVLRLAPSPSIDGPV